MKTNIAFAVIDKLVLVPICRVNFPVNQPGFFYYQDVYSTLFLTLDFNIWDYNDKRDSIFCTIGKKSQASKTEKWNLWSTS